MKRKLDIIKLIMTHLILLNYLKVYNNALIKKAYNTNIYSISCWAKIRTDPA